MIVTLGNQPSGENNAAIYELQVDGALTHEFTMSEQGNHNIPLLMYSGAVVIGGSDAVEAVDEWAFGNIYVKSDGVWSKKRTLPNVMHVFGVCEHDGKLYVGTGAHAGDNATWEARVFWSDDIGDTWESSYVCYYRVRDLISFGGVLYASCHDWPNYKVYKSLDDGLTWISISIVPEPLIRMVIWNDRLLILDVDRLTLHALDATGNDTAFYLPSTIALPQNCANYLAVCAGDLYVLTGSNTDKIYKREGTEWHYHCNLGERCCSLLNFEDEFLIASTVGVDAKILKIAL